MAYTTVCDVRDEQKAVPLVGLVWRMAKPRVEMKYIWHDRGTLSAIKVERQNDVVVCEESRFVRRL